MLFRKSVLIIKNRYAAESAGFTVGSGTPQAQTPVGKPCN